MKLPMIVVAVCLSTSVQANDFCYALADYSVSTYNLKESGFPESFTISQMKEQIEYPQLHPTLADMISAIYKLPNDLPDSFIRKTALKNCDL